MITIQEAEDDLLTWVQPRPFTRSYELRSNGHVLSRLQWGKPLGSLATVESADGEWSFKRIGFLRPRVTVRVPGAGTDRAIFHPNWGGGGKLELADGRGFRLISTNFWRSEWAFTDEEGNQVVCFRPKYGLARGGAQVEIGPEGHSVPDLSLLVALGWYLMILMADDMAVTSAVVVAGTA